MADVDFGKIKLFVGNYDFWLHSSQLAAKLLADQNAKKEEKIKELLITSLNNILVEITQKS